MLGSVIGDGDAEVVGVGDGGAVVVVAVGDAVGEAPAFGWFVHVVSTRTRRSNPRMPQGSHDLTHAASDLAAPTLTI